jgi:hypothetical protein
VNSNAARLDVIEGAWIDYSATSGLFVVPDGADIVVGSYRYRYIGKTIFVHIAFTYDDKDSTTVDFKLKTPFTPRSSGVVVGSGFDNRNGFAGLPFQVFTDTGAVIELKLPDAALWDTGAVPNFVTTEFFYEAI